MIRISNRRLLLLFLSLLPFRSPRLVDNVAILAKNYVMQRKALGR